MLRGWKLWVLVGAVAATGTAVALPSALVAGTTARTSCKPPFLTSKDVGAALGAPSSKYGMVPLKSSAIPPVGSEPFEGKTFECDFELTAGSQSGFQEGRASLYVFAAPAEAKRWFTASTASDDPRCKKVSFTTTACLQNVSSPPGVFPLFQAVKGSFVVWIHLKQLRLDSRPLKTLASKVLMRAPRVT